MLRKRVRAFAMEKKYRPCIKMITRLMQVVGILWILSFPFMARNVFTSENALRGERVQTYFNENDAAYPTYQRIKNDFEAF